MNISNYQLGILFSIGSYISSENKLVIRHKDVHYINSLQPIFNTKLYSQLVNNEIQYVIKSQSNIELYNYLLSHNYSPYNSEIKTIPILSDYKDFLRAYIEVYSSLDYLTRYSNKKSKEKYKELRLRIYGNKMFLESINNILYEYCFTTIKSIQILSNDKTAILYYSSLTEIKAIYDYIYETPCNQPLMK